MSPPARRILRNTSDRLRIVTTGFELLGLGF